MLSLPPGFFNFWIFTLGSVVIVFFCIRLGVALNQVKKLKLEEFYQELGIEDLEC